MSKISADKIKPLSRPTLPSRINLGKILPRSLSPLAKDCTTIAEDCTPTFPPIAVMRGMKNAMAGMAVILDSKLEITLKINKLDLSSIIRTFERYDYVVKESFQKSMDNDDLQARFDSLMHYLKF